MGGRGVDCFPKIIVGWVFWKNEVLYWGSCCWEKERIFIVVWDLWVL